MLVDTTRRSSLLIYDLIPCVMEFCQNDYAFLFRCALVNWEFNRVASRMLYSRVVIAPQFKPVLNLRDTSPTPKLSNFASASLPRYAPYVLFLQVSGFVSPRPPPRNTLSTLLATAIKSFTYLRDVRFTAATYHEDLFTPSISVLCSVNTLTHLSVNESCFSESRAPTLVQISGLRSLTLVNPGRAILQLLPAWLEKLSSTLTQFHLKDNCGSVTPGVLNSFLPHVQYTIRAFTLGLSYSLSDRDTFAFLEKLTHLERLTLRYYLQMKQSPRPPRLAALRSFTATYSDEYMVGEVTSFAKWARRAIAGSPHLEEVHITCESTDPLPLMTYDSLVDSLVKKRFAGLRVLDLGAAVVTIRKLKEVLSACLQLEHSSMTADRSVLRVFLIKSRDNRMLRYLRSVSFQLSNAPRKYNAEELKGLLSTIMQNPRFPALRRVTINDISWEGSYTFDSDLRCQLVVERMTNITAPWYRKED